LALSLAAACLAVLTLVKVTSVSWSAARAKGLVLQAVKESRPDPNSLPRHLASAKSAADALKEKNLFVPRPPKEHPVKQVEGILGREVLIAGHWYGVGAKVGDAKIVAIGPTEVKIEWDGQEKTFSPIASASAPTPAAAAVQAIKKAAGRPPGAPPAPVAAGEKKAESAPEDPFAWLGVPLSPQLRERLLERWNKMSDEEKEDMKQKWNDMPEDQKKRAIEGMEKGMG
jgi:hypothetical protein